MPLNIMMKCLILLVLYY